MLFRGRLGDKLDFFTFEKKFNDYVENCGVYSKHEKLIKLRSECLSDDAYNAIAEIESFELAMTHLKTLYAKPEVMFAFKVDELKKLGKCPETALECESWCIAVRSKFQALKKLAQSHNLSDCLDISDVITVITKSLTTEDHALFQKRLLEKRLKDPTLKISRKVLTTEMGEFLDWLIAKASLGLDYALALEYRDSGALVKGLNVTSTRAEKAKPAARKTYMCADTEQGLDEARPGDGGGASFESTASVHAATNGVSGAMHATGNGARVVMSSQPGEAKMKVCKVCKGSHTIMSYCSKFITVRVKDRWALICKAMACYRCLKLDAEFTFKERTKWFSSHEKFCDGSWVCNEPGCKNKDPIRQNHFLLCTRHIPAGQEREVEYMKTLDQSLLGGKESFYFNTIPMYVAKNPPPIETEIDATLLEPDVNDPPVYILQNVDAPGGEKLLTFFDSGCYSAGMSDRAFSLLPSTEVRPGPTILELANGVTSKVAHGDYRIFLPLERTVGGKNKVGTITALRMPQISSVFPLWPLQKAWEDIVAAYTAEKPGALPLPLVQDEVGGANVDLMLGARYFRYFPQLIFSLPSGLGIYQAIIKASGGKAGILGGPHPAWKAAVNCSHLVTARLYLCQEMRAFTVQNQALRRVMTLPAVCDDLVGRGQFDFVAKKPEACGCEFIDEQLAVSDEEKPARWAMMHVSRQVREFQMTDEVGAEVSYRCPRCRQCNPCKQGEEIEKISLMEEQEQALIESCLHMDTERKVVVAKLPFIADPSTKLRPNKRIAEKVLETQMRLIKKNPETKEDILKSHDKLFTKGHVVALKDLPPHHRELAERDGYFIPWRTVYNTGSISTPCRMVFDASSRTPGGGSLNEVLAKGQNKLAGLYNLLIKFRGGQAAFAADISMAYNAIKLAPEFLQFHKYLWIPGLDENIPPEIMVILTLIYGVKSAGNLTMAGFQLVAETAAAAGTEFKLGADALKNNSYMDDLFKAYLEFVTRDLATVSLEKTLEFGSMGVKAITKSGQPPCDKVSVDGETVGLVGYVWYVEEDMLGLDIKPITLGKAKRGKPAPPVEGDVKTALADKFTRRVIAGRVAAVFDPLGLAAPITGRLKLDLSEVCKNSTDWDSPLPPELLDRWVANLADIQRLQDFRVPRNVFGRITSDQKVMLIVCCDASEVLAAAAVYARVEDDEGNVECSLVTAKTKLVNKSTVPRAELRAVCMGASLGHVVKSAYQDQVGDILYVSDSTIALSWINQDQRPLMCGVRNAVIEVRRLSDLKNWWHVESHLNPVDVATRAISTTDLIEGTDWVFGMEWMRGDAETMPVRAVEDITLSGSEKVEINKEVRNQEPRGIVLSNFIDQVSQRYHFSDYLIDPCLVPWHHVMRRLAVVARCAKIWLRKAQPLKLGADGKRIMNITDQDTEAAEKYLFTTTTKEVQHFVDEKTLSKLGSVRDGVLYYEARIVDGTQPTSLGRVMIDLKPLYFCRPIVDRHSPVAAAVMMHAHIELSHHGGAVTTLRRALEIVFIINGRGLAEEVRKKCMHCKRYDAQLLQAEMGKLHESRLVVAPPFYSSQVDLVGPFEASCEHNHRAKVKVWGAVFKCTSTLAVAVECMASYGTDSFVLAYQRFAARYGHPGHLHMDEGSQLKKACKEMDISMVDLSKSLTSKFGVKIDCSFSPVGAHESSGMVERSIKEVRRIFAAVFKGRRLDILGYQSAFYYIANELNSMPLCIGTKYKNLDNLDLITPSRLLHGRNNNRAPVGTITLTSTPTRLLRQIDEVDRAWWSCWEAEWLIELIPRPDKWRTGRPDVDVDDIVVFLRDGHEAKIGATPWRIGRVVAVERSNDGVLRTVVIEYRNHNERSFRQTRRSIRSVAILWKEGDLDLPGELSAAAKAGAVHWMRVRGNEGAR